MSRKQKFLVLVTSLLGCLLFSPSLVALAGGWAVITLDELPQQVVIGEPVAIAFMVRQHGHSPLQGLTPQVRLVNPNNKEVITITAKELEGEIGHYRATFSLPTAGEWQWSIGAFTINQPMPPLVVQPALASPDDAPRPPSLWPLLVGVGGLLGTVGVSFVWWRQRKGWALGLMPVSLIISTLGFVVANYTPFQVEAHSQPATLSQKEMGQALFVAKGCPVCHQHAAITLTPDIMTNSGGNLIHLALTPAYLRLWLKDPAALKPNTQMPTLNLSEVEIEALIAFLIDTPDEAAAAEICPITSTVKDQPPDDPNADPFG